MHRLGYTWVMRMDDDSYILSKVPYNIFSFMENNNLNYGYRNVARESGETGLSFHRFLRNYVKNNDIKDHWLLETTCKKRRSIDDFTVDNCGEFYGFYNNFFVSNVSWWLQPHVQKFIKKVDDIFDVKEKEILVKMIM